MRPKGSAEELERRRRRAVGLFQKGYGPTRIAEMVGATRRAVQRWVRRFEAGGTEALDATPHRGPRPRLTQKQKDRLAVLLLRGAKANGFGTDLWTCRRIGQLIHQHFGQRYHHSHVGRILHQMGWTSQKPRKKAYERDEAAIARWRDRDWPRIKKSP